jgi:hypothetical protein
MAKRRDTKVAFTLNTSRALEERLVDWLLARDDVTGFTSYAVQGHAARDYELSAAEQVAGRQRRQEIRVELRSTDLDAFVAALERDHGEADLYWFVVPVVRSGHFGKHATGPWRSQPSCK